MISRREVIAGAAALLAPVGAVAQQAGPAHRIGLLAQELQPGLLDTFRDGLRSLGYVEGGNIAIEVRDAAGQSDRLAGLAEDLLRLKVEVIVAVNTPAAKAAQKATATVPVVIMRVADPVKSGLIASLARPGGNITGMSFMPAELGAKGIELLREVLPGISRIGAFYQRDNPGAVIIVNEVEARGKRLGLQLLRLPVATPKDYAQAFAAAAGAGTQALFVMDDGTITRQRRAVLDLAAQHSLPVVAIYKDFAEAGALLSYGPDLPALYRRGAYFVDRILKGEAPSRLPVEQPKRFALFVNLRTAKQLGLTIPQQVLARADDIIE